MEAMRRGPVEYVLTSTEAAAGFMATVCMLTGRPGACYGTYGPGATNLCTGVGAAFLDRAPVLAFTTEAPERMRHRTLQMHIDHQALFRPLTKWTTRLQAANLRQTLRRAVQMATAEVPGLGLPEDLGPQPMVPEAGTVRMQRGQPAPPPPAEEQLHALAHHLRQAKRPLLVLGLSCALGWEALQHFIDRQRLPVVLSPMAKGFVREDHASYVGVVFHALSNIVAETIRDADLVLAIGYDPVEFNYEEWLTEVPLLHVDTVPADVDDSCHLAAEVVGDIGTVLRFLATLPPLPHTWDLAAVSERQRMCATLTAPRAAVTLTGPWRDSGTPAERWFLDVRCRCPYAPDWAGVADPCARPSGDDQWLVVHGVWHSCGPRHQAVSS